MGCNCGKSRSKQWVYVNSEGKQQTYPSEVQAKAAQVRAGGGGFVKAI